MDEALFRSPRPIEGYDDAGASYDVEVYRHAGRILSALAKAVLAYRAEHPGVGTVTASVSPAEARVLRKARYTLRELNEHLAGVGGELAEVRVPDDSPFAVVASGFPEVPVTIEDEPPPFDFAAPVVRSR